MRHYTSKAKQLAMILQTIEANEHFDNLIIWYSLIVVRFCRHSGRGCEYISAAIFYPALAAEQRPTVAHGATVGKVIEQTEPR
jgi:hypothetical protein